MIYITGDCHQNFERFNMSIKELKVVDVKDNIFVIGLDMENRSPEEIAKDAALQIAAITDSLIEKQKAETKSRKEEQQDKL